jgi:hypothetical protein
VREILNGMMPEMATVVGDFNCCGGTKKRVLGEIIETEDWDDVGTTKHTHEWGKHRCRIDRVLTREGEKPRGIEEGWGFLSDHKS